MFGWLKRKRAAEVKTLQDAMIAKMFGEPVAATAEAGNTRARILEQAMANFPPSGYLEFKDEPEEADVRWPSLLTGGGFYVERAETGEYWHLCQHMPERPPRFVRAYTDKSNATRAARKLNVHDDMHRHEPADYKLGFYVAPGHVPHSWGVFQRGKMLSTYTLKSNATRAARKLNGHD